MRPITLMGYIASIEDDSPSFMKTGDLIIRQIFGEWNITSVAPRQAMTTVFHSVDILP